MHVFAALAAIAFVFVPAAQAIAQQSPALTLPDPAAEIRSPEDMVDSPESRLTRDDVEAWLDGFMPMHCLGEYRTGAFRVWPA